MAIFSRSDDATEPDPTNDSHQAFANNDQYRVDYSWVDPEYNSVYPYHLEWIVSDSSGNRVAKGKAMGNISSQVKRDAKNAARDALRAKIMRDREIEPDFLTINDL